LPLTSNINLNTSTFISFDPIYVIENLLHLAATSDTTATLRFLI